MTSSPNWEGMGLLVVVGVHFPFQHPERDVSGIQVGPNPKREEGMVSQTAHLLRQRGIYCCWLPLSHSQLMHFLALTQSTIKHSHWCIIIITPFHSLPHSDASQILWRKAQTMESPAAILVVTCKSTQLVVNLCVWVVAPSSGEYM